MPESLVTANGAAAADWEVASVTAEKQHCGGVCFRLALGSGSTVMLGCVDEGPGDYAVVAREVGCDEPGLAVARLWTGGSQVGLGTGVARILEGGRRGQDAHVLAVDLLFDGQAEKARVRGCFQAHGTAVE